MAQTVKVLKVFPLSDYAVVRWERNGDYQWIACWSPRIKGVKGERRPDNSDENTDRLMYWGQGHYFQCPEDAFIHACHEEEEAVAYMIQEITDFTDRMNIKLDRLADKLGVTLE
jgi:hypothetical protein